MGCRAGGQCVAGMGVLAERGPRRLSGEMRETEQSPADENESLLALWANALRRLMRIKTGKVESLGELRAKS